MDEFLQRICLILPSFEKTLHQLGYVFFSTRLARPVSCHTFDQSVSRRWKIEFSWGGQCTQNQRIRRWRPFRGRWHTVSTAIVTRSLRRNEMWWLRAEEMGKQCEWSIRTNSISRSRDENICWVKCRWQYQSIRYCLASSDRLVWFQNDAVSHRPTGFH